MFQTFILPLLIFVGLGILAGLILSVASVLLSVKTDEKEESIRAILPGVNCGACGFAGCDAYAQQLAKGEAKTNLCVPGGDRTSKQISELLGVAYEDVEEQTAFVRCNGTKSLTQNRYYYTGTPSCEACNMFYAGKGTCDYGCLGFGDCVAVCNYDAIHIQDGVAKVERNKCVGCGLCAKQCPKGLIDIVPLSSCVHVACASCAMGKETRSTCKSGCIACRRCEKACPNDAITITDNCARIDYAKCSHCGKCAELCPSQCIRIEA